jgi:hypothetical protein
VTADPLWFPNTAARIAARLPVALAFGASLEFASATINLWRGFGTVVAGGKTWLGAGEMGDVSKFEVGINAAPTEAVELTLSGLSADVMAAYDAQPSEIARRRARLYVLSFDEEGNVLDDPVCIRTARMDRARREYDAESQLWAVRLFCEPLTLDKHRPAFAFMTHDDQMARTGQTDKIFERVSEGRRTVIWG